MRIAYMVTSLGVGGAERQVIALGERMAGRGHAITLVVLKAAQVEQWATELPVIHLDMRKSPAGVAAGLSRAHGALRGFAPEIIHSHTFPANMAARVLGLFHPGAAVLSTIHNVYEGGRARMTAYRLTDAWSAHTTAVSTAAAERYVRLKAVGADKCSVLTNGIDTTEFAADPERRAEMRRELGVGSEFQWLATGRVVAAKDYPNLLRAFALGSKAEPMSRLAIAGEAGRSELEALKRLAEGLGVEGRVKWLGLRRDVPALLDAADGFVLGSAWEGMPLALGEAMAMEKPVVATDVGGVREMAGECGSVVPAKAPEALAEALVAVMRTSPEARGAGGKAARERIFESFSMDAKADEWERLYRRLLERRR